MRLQFSYSDPPDRDRPELMPGELGQVYRNRHPYYDLNCHLRHEYDAHVDITVNPINQDSDNASHPMKYQTYKTNAYVPCTSTLNYEDSFEEQYKRSVNFYNKTITRQTLFIY
jgi:hypothetical protein